MMALSRYTVTLSMGSVTAMSALHAAGAIIEAMAITVVRRMLGSLFCTAAVWEVVVNGNKSMAIRI